MVPDLGDIVAAWPFAASLAAAASARGVQEARRRSALNEALHELRRPLQALTLARPRSGGGSAAGGGYGGAERFDDVLQMTTAALERLEREVNGEAVALARRVVAAKPLIEAAVARWRPVAAAAGSSLRLLWRADESLLFVDDARVAQAIDNLLVNAIEHGGNRIEVEVAAPAGGLRIAVRDLGPRASERRGRQIPALQRVPRPRRRGHGLRVVRRVADEHGGRFELRRSRAATEAVLVLPPPAAGGRT